MSTTFLCIWYSNPVHRGDPCSCPDLVKWDLRWIKWRWSRFSPSTSVPPSNLYSTKFSILTSTRGRYSSSEVADVLSGPSLDSTPPPPTMRINKWINYNPISLLELTVSARGACSVHKALVSAQVKKYFCELRRKINVVTKNYYLLVNELGRKYLQNLLFFAGPKTYVDRNGFNLKRTKH
jgi:hypothetical protein